MRNIISSKKGVALRNKKDDELVSYCMTYDDGSLASLRTMEVR
jgi:hypothetical protein